MIELPGQAKETPRIILGDKPAPKVLTDEQKFHEKKQAQMVNTIRIPDIYFWIEFDQTEKPVAMTAAFTYNSKAHGFLQFGETWKVEDTWGRTSRKTYQKKLCGKMVETLDVLTHHGDSILDRFGNINFTALQNAEAERFFRDPHWADRLGAFSKIVRVKVINYKKAVELKLI